MAYLVLARKYRPQTFDEIVGQSQVTRTLVNAIRSDRVHHAYLFCGVRGLGKTTAARVLAKCLVCEQGPTPTPCNACSHCTAVMDGGSVDVLEIDGASNNSVEDIRSLRDQVHYLPQFTRRKIYIIDEVHMLTASAFNALLKTLEEPPPHVTFIFATTDPHKVLPTILSRVSRLDFRRVRLRELVDHLREICTRESVKVEDEALAVVAGAAEGSVRDAMTALDKLIAFGEDPTEAGIGADEARAILGQADRASVAALADAVFARDATSALERFDAITQIGCDLQQFALSYLQHLRDLLVVSRCGRHDALLDLPDTLLEPLEAQARELDPTRIAQHFDRFSRVLEQLEASRVPKMVLEMALLDLVQAEPLIPLGDLVERLGALESGSGGPPRGGGGAGGGAAPRGNARDPRADPGRRRAHAQPAAERPVAPAQASRAENPTPAPSRAEDPTPAPAPSRAEDPTPAPTSTPDFSSWRPPEAPPKARPQRRPEPKPTPEPSASPPRAANPNSSSRGPDAKATPQGMSGMVDQFRAMLGADADFTLRAPESEPEPATPRPEQAPPDAGCSSSRCLPRDTITLDKHSPFEAWELFLDQVRAEDELLFAVLADFGLLELAGERLRLAAARGSFCADQLAHRPELRARLDELLAACFGAAIRVDLEDQTPVLPEIPSLSLVEARRKRAHQQKVEQRARTHPGIRAVLDTFGGTLSSVEALTPPPRDPLEPAPRS